MGTFLILKTLMSVFKEISIKGRVAFSIESLSMAVKNEFSVEKRFEVMFYVLPNIEVSIDYGKDGYFVFEKEGNYFGKLNALYTHGGQAPGKLLVNVK